MTKSDAGRLGHIKSKVIQEKHLKERIDAYNKCPKLCKRCEKPLSYNKKRCLFCNHSCAASFNNLGNRKWGNPKKTRSIKELWINKKIEVEKGLVNTPTTLKKYLREVRGYVCSVCGILKWMGKELSLVLDHIDGNSGNCCPNNLRLVCPNCDSQLPTYKGKNKGNGRYSRKLRYQQGLSY